MTPLHVLAPAPALSVLVLIEKAIDSASCIAAITAG